jgi:PEP-CTERM motif
MQILALRAERSCPLTSIAVPNNLHTVQPNAAHFERAPTCMRLPAKALCLLAIAATATVAKADTFKLTGDGDTYTFSIASSPTVIAIPFGFEITGITVTDDGVATPNSTLTFYDTAYGGGLEIQPNANTLVFDSDQLYSGTNASPTFLIGTFKLTDDIDGSKYKLVIKDDPSSTSSVPEPSSLGLLATGTLAFAGAVRRKLLSR